MITEDYCSYGVAKLLKEKGFNDECRAAYTNYGKLFTTQIQQYITNILCDKGYLWNCTAPTLQMAMKWLREVHHYYIQIMLDSWALGDHSGYYVVIQKTDSDFEMMLQDAVNDVFYQTYEEAVEAALKYSLETLI